MPKPPIDIAAEVLKIRDRAIRAVAAARCVLGSRATEDEVYHAAEVLMGDDERLAEIEAMNLPAVPDPEDSENAPN